MNWSLCSKDSEVSACALTLPQLKLGDGKIVPALNFLQTGVCVVE